MITFVPYFKSPTRAENQVSLVMLAAKLGASQRPRWWQWCVWLAAASAVRRIEDDGE